MTSPLKAPACVNDLALAIRTSLTRGRPPYVTWYATRRCNSQCAACSVPKESRAELSVAEVSRLGQQCVRLGAVIIGVQGGEPFLRPDLNDCLKALQHSGLTVGVVTNGTVVQPKAVTELASAGVSVCVSLDSLDRVRYVRLRGMDGLERVKALLGSVTAACRRRVSVHMTVSAINHDEIFQVAQYVNALGYPLSILPVVGGSTMRHRRQADELICSATRALIADSFSEVVRMYERYWFAVSLDVLTAAIDYLRTPFLEECGAAKYSLTIDSDGAVAPCPDLPSFGNVRHSSLEQIWNDREAIGEAIESCRRAHPCFYGCTAVKVVSFRDSDRIQENLQRTKYGLML